MATLIVARDQKSGIGKNGSLPWHCPEDLRHFKRLTTNMTVLMGVNTALCCIKRPLPNRNNWVLVPQDREVPAELADAASGWTVFRDVHSALRAQPHLFVIGGASLYKDLVYHPYVTDAYVTEIDADYDCDRFFDYEFRYPGWLSDVVARHPATDDGVGFVIHRHVRMPSVVGGAP